MRCRNQMDTKKMKIINKQFCPKFHVGEEVKRCYIQNHPTIGVMYYSLETGIQQIIYDEEEQIADD